MRAEIDKLRTRNGLMDALALLTLATVVTISVFFWRKRQKLTQS